MDTKLRAYLAEFLGTFVLVYLGAGTVCAFYLPEGYRVEVTGVALAVGAVLAVMLSTTYLVSGGCLNPAITLLLYVYKRYDRGQMFLLIVVQLIGAVLGGLAVRLTFSDGVLTAARMGTPHLTGALLGPEHTLTLGGRFTGVCLEIFFTALLTVAVFVSLIDKRGPRVGGMLVGLAQAAAIVFGFYLTGGAANPARWFGPVVWEATLPPHGPVWDDHMVYWAGPFVGALVGALLYSAVIGPPVQTPERGR
jgi:aquaporin Z